MEILSFNLFASDGKTIIFIAITLCFYLKKKKQLLRGGNVIKKYVESFGMKCCGHTQNVEKVCVST